MILLLPPTAHFRLMIMTEMTVFVCLALTVAGTLLALDGTGTQHQFLASCV